MGRRVLSVFLGMLTWVVVMQGVQAVVLAVRPGAFAEDGSTDSAGLLVAFLFVSVAASIAAGWVTARTAARARMKHVLVLGVIQLGLGIYFQASYWEAQPLWYHIPFLTLLLPATLLGGMQVRQAGSAR